MLKCKNSKATKAQVEQRVAKKTWLKPRMIGTAKVESKETGLLCFDPTDAVDRQGHLMPARSIMVVRSNVPFDILVTNLTNFTVYV